MPGSVAFNPERETALRRLVDDGVLTPEQGEAVRQALLAAEPANRGPARWLVEVAGYVGGGLMLGGAALFLSASWNELSRAARSGVLVGFAVALAAAGVLVAGGPARVAGLPRGGARRRIVGVLFALAAAPAALAAFVAADRYPGLSHPAPVASLTGLVVAVAGMVLLPTFAGESATAIASLLVVTSYAVDVLHAPPLPFGLLLAALGLVWVLLALSRVLPSRPLGLAIGAGLALLGAQQPAGSLRTAPWGFGLAFALAVGFMLVYRWERSVVLLVAGVVGMTVAVPEAVVYWTDGAIGGSLVLLVAGAVLVGASAVGLRIRRSGPLAVPPVPGPPPQV